MATAHDERFESLVSEVEETGSNHDLYSSLNDVNDSHKRNTKTPNGFQWFINFEMNRHIENIKNIYMQISRFLGCRNE